MAVIPRPADATVFDQLLHANAYKDIQTSFALCKMAFKNNDIDSFREKLLNVLGIQQLIKQATWRVCLFVPSRRTTWMAM